MLDNRNKIAALLLASGILLAGCGGGGGGDDDNENNNFVQQSIQAEADDARSGYLTSGGFIAADSDLFVGTIPNVPGAFLEQRGIIAFDLPALPADAQVVSAVLTMMQVNTTGTPYEQVVQFIVDHIASPNASLSDTDFNGFTLEVIANPPLSTNATQEAKQIDVTEQVENDLQANRDQSMFRVRGQAINPLTAGNNDPVDPVDLARFANGAGGSRLDIVVAVPEE
jgi:hypothetical protein